MFWYIGVVSCFCSFESYEVLNVMYFGFKEYVVWFFLKEYVWEVGEVWFWYFDRWWFGVYVDSM